MAGRDQPLTGADPPEGAPAKDPSGKGGPGEGVAPVLIGSLLLTLALLYWFGAPRLARWLTPDVRRVHVVSAALGDSLATAGPREVAAGTPVTLFAVVEAVASDGSPRYYGPVDRLRLGSGESPAVDAEPWSSRWLGLEILWFKVEPLHPFFNEQQSETFRPVDIQYAETLMTSWGFAQRHAADITPTGDEFPRWAVGTMRYRVRAVVRDQRGRVVAQALSPGAAAVHAREPWRRPHRVSVRDPEGVLGRMRGYAGLPYVPMPPSASARAVEAYLGGTVLDFWVGAQRQLGRDLPFHSWSELPRHADLVADDIFLARDGLYYYGRDPLRQVRFGEVQVGDLLAIDDHVGVLLEDRGPEGAPDGVLGRGDRVLEAYFEPLRESALGDAFVSGVQVYRWDTGVAGDAVGGSEGLDGDHGGAR